MPTSPPNRSARASSSAFRSDGVGRAPAGGDQLAQAEAQPGAGVVVAATTVAVGGRAALITGPSGSGKSALALQMMALGAVLVADDRTVLCDGAEGLAASAPEAIRGMIEARGMGLLQAEAGSARIVVVVDLGRTETERMPPARTTVVAGRRLPLLHKIDGPHFAAALLQYLRCGPCPT